MNSYLQWKYQNPLYGKKVSILSDSMSALQGFIPAGYTPSYSNMEKGVRSMWWGQVLDYFGAELLVNSSMADSTIASSTDTIALMPSAASDARLFSLQSQTFVPDEIWIFNGYNDVQKPLVQTNGTSLKEVSCALKQTIQTLQAYFPHAHIRVLSLPKVLSIYAAQLNKELESVAKETNVFFHDLSNVQVYLDAYSHLDAKSHLAIASRFIEDLDQAAFHFITETQKPIPTAEEVHVEDHIEALKKIAPELLQGSETASVKEEPKPEIDETFDLVQDSKEEQEQPPVLEDTKETLDEPVLSKTEEVVEESVKENPGEELFTKDLEETSQENLEEAAEDVYAEESIEEKEDQEQPVKDLPEEVVYEDEPQEVSFEEEPQEIEDQVKEFVEEEPQEVLMSDTKEELFYEEVLQKEQEPEEVQDKIQETQVVFKDSPRSFSRKSRNASLIEAIAKESDTEAKTDEPQKEQPVRLSPITNQNEWIWGLQDEQNDEFYEFSEENMVIGRLLLETDITFKDKNISRKHATVLKRGNSWYIQDLGSANGTYLNQKPLLANIQYLLQDGDTLRFADKKLKFIHKENA